MRKKSILARPDQIGYAKAINVVFEELNISEQDRALLFDYFVNEIPLEDLSIQYQLPKEKIISKLSYLKEQMQNNLQLLQIRNHSNLKGKKR